MTSRENPLHSTSRPAADPVAADDSQLSDPPLVGIYLSKHRTPHLRLNSGTSDLAIDGEPGSKSSGVNREIVFHTIDAQDSSPLSAANSVAEDVVGLMDQAQNYLLLPKPRRRAKLKITQAIVPKRRLQSSTSLVSRRLTGRTRSIDHFRHTNGLAFNTQNITRKLSFIPSTEFLVAPEDVEKDDFIHDTNSVKKNAIGCCTRRPLLKIAGLILVTLGILVLFVGFPAFTFVKHAIDLRRTPCERNPDCISDDYPLLINVRTTTIDPDTPKEFRTKIAHDGRALKLVFSDEFNTPGRSFYPEDDPFFEAVDLWYGVTQDLEWYDPDAISTADGALIIQFDAYRNHNLSYRSGMLQSWNKLCFKGGHVEASISLPGSGTISGFWPGFWAMGNLGRPGYASTTDGMWPYSYWDKCDAGIMKNQSSPNGLSFLPGMKLPACTCAGEDHPSPGKSRSAPEIDAIEASVGWSGSERFGTASQSAQVAPFDVKYRPNYDFVELYNPNLTHINAYRGGPFQETLSGVSNLNNAWYGGNAYQTYAFEYVPGERGHIIWYIGDIATWRLDAQAIGPNGNIGQRLIPEEPMALVVNLGMSPSFAWIDNEGIDSILPVMMRVDYIRIYQDEKGVLGCDPPGYPTTEYIASHPESYLNVNKTLWSETSYRWPTNSLVDGCS